MEHEELTRQINFGEQRVEVKGKPRSLPELSSPECFIILFIL
jgi:hypothetical protein